MKNGERIANLALAGLTLAPLFVKVDPNLNVILSACLTVYVGCYRSVKPTPPAETMSHEHAMRFPFVGSAMLLSLFLLFKFLSKDLVNAVLTCYFFVLGIVALSATLLPAIKRYLPRHWNENPIIWHFPYFRSLEIEFTRSQVIAAIPGTFFCAWYASQKHWLANNILGLSFCIQGIEMLSLGSFKTGAILLAGLFVYDIFWVFFTPVMVSVAKSFDAPIKLLFPTRDASRPFSMLGLGDIVIPGIFVALALRFDVSRGKDSQYFKSAFLGYTFGVVLTIIVMNWFQAAQPALLYIVPAVIGFLAAHVIWNGEVKPLMEFEESAGSSQESDKPNSGQKFGRALCSYGISFYATSVRPKSILGHVTTREVPKESRQKILHPTKVKIQEREQIIPLESQKAMEDLGEAQSEENTVCGEKNNKRKLKTPAQVIGLEKFYKEHKYPTEEMKSELAECIGLTEKQISSWFCHRRLKDNRSLKDEAYANGRLDRSSGILQDHGSGLWQDSCGSTKLGDYRNIDPREVQSQRLYRHDFPAADITHDHASPFIGNASGMDDTSSESGSSLQHKFSPKDEDAYDIETSRYLPQNGVTIPFVPKGATSMGHKPSGYLKVKGEIENAAITAVKKQLGRHYKEDGPPLGVEFQSLPPDAFASPSRNPINGPFYVGDLGRIHSPGVSEVRKQSSLSTLTRKEAHSSWRTSQDSDMEGPKCHPINASDSHEMKSHHQLKQRSTSYNYSNSNPGRHSPMDSYDDLAGETSVYSSKGNYKLRFKHDMEAIRSDSVSNHHGCDGRINTREHMEHCSHEDHSSSPKMAQRNETVSKPSKSVLGSHKFLDTDERSPSSRMAKEDKLYGEMKGTKHYQIPDRVKVHPTNESKVVKRFRVELSQQEYVSKASFPVVLGRSNSTKGSFMGRPSSFTEDETAETSFFWGSRIPKTRKGSKV